MNHWRKTWYSLIGPLMIWVVFIIAVPLLSSAALIGSADLTPAGIGIVRTIGVFCALVFAPLAALAEIAPPFVTREEVNWRNRNSDELFESDVAWEHVPFFPPILNRIRATTTRRRRQDEKEDVSTASAAKTSTSTA